MRSSEASLQPDSQRLLQTMLLVEGSPDHAANLLFKAIGPRMPLCFGFLVMSMRCFFFLGSSSPGAKARRNRNEKMLDAERGKVPWNVPAFLTRPGVPTKDGPNELGIGGDETKRTWTGKNYGSIVSQYL